METKRKDEIAFGLAANRASDHGDELRPEMGVEDKSRDRIEVDPEPFQLLPRK